ncbi:MAG: hypothetical protein JWM16_5706 [Verrucomicrobiales bacterium]|nr:hypothetical protein [Verrucomicrobiales bacterium]
MTEPAAAEIPRRITPFTRRRGSEGVLPNYRRAVVPAAETYDEQRMWTFPAAPTSPAFVSGFGQHEHAHDETLINSTAPASINPTIQDSSYPLVHQSTHPLPRSMAKYSPTLWNALSPVVTHLRGLKVWSQNHPNPLHPVTPFFPIPRVIQGSTSDATLHALRPACGFTI